MSVLQLRHIKTKLHQSYENLIDTSDSLARTDEEKENVFLTRAFAAYTIQVFASISETEAAKSVTDGIDDNGIDAVYFDRGCKILWLVQTKWKNKGEVKHLMGADAPVYRVNVSENPRMRSLVHLKSIPTIIIYRNSREEWVITEDWPTATELASRLRASLQSPFIC